MPGRVGNRVGRGRSWEQGASTATGEHEDGPGWACDLHCGSSPPAEQESPGPGRPPHWADLAIFWHLGSELPGNPTPAAQVGLRPPSPEPRAPVTCSHRDERPPARPRGPQRPPAGLPTPGWQGVIPGEPEPPSVPGPSRLSSPGLASRTQLPLSEWQPVIAALPASRPPAPSGCVSPKPCRAWAGPRRDPVSQDQAGAGAWEGV